MDKQNIQNKKKYLIVGEIGGALTVISVILFLSGFGGNSLREKLMGLEQREKWEIAYSDGGSLYFLSMSGKSKNIFKTRPTNFYGPTYLSLSPYGDKIAFVCNDDNFNRYSTCLLVSNIDGNHQRKLIEAHGIGTIAWSPDGKNIAYLQSEWTNNKEIWSLKTINLQGNIKTLTQDVYFLSSLSWSPDSQKIVFTSQDGLVTIIDVDSGKLRKVVKGDFVSWSPTGEIVYRDYEGDKPHWTEYHSDGGFTDYFASGEKFYIMNADGTDKRLFLNVKKKLRGLFDFLTVPGVSTPMTWSPDGKFVIFGRSYVSFPSYATRIYVMEVSTKKVVKISTVMQTFQLSWVKQKL